MRATDRLGRNAGAALGAFLGRGFRGRRFLFFLEAIYLLDEHEDREGHDGEIQDGVDEHPVFEGDRLGGLGFIPEGDGQIGKIDIPHDQPNRRHDDVLDQGADNLAEGAADDDADRHVNNVATHGKLFEFIKYLHFFPRLWVCAARVQAMSGLPVLPIC